MSTVKKFTFAVFATLLVSTLLGLAPAWGAYQTFKDAGPLKSALRESGMYQTGVEDALQQSQEENPDHTQQNIPVDRPEVQEVVKKAFPPAYVQEQAENAIDSTYAWLKGDMPRLHFTIDVEEAKIRLADGMGSYAENRLNSLPACDTTNLQIDPYQGDVDPLTAACVPPGFNKAEAVTRVRDEILKGEFLKNTTVSADTIKDGQGRPLGDQLQAGPVLYDTTAVAIYTIIVIAAGLAVGTVLLSPTWRLGLRRTGIMLLSAGAASGLLAWLTDSGMQKATTEFMKTAQGNLALQEKVMKIAALLVADMRGHWMLFSVVVMMLGAILIAAWYFLKPSAAEAAEVLAHGMPPMKEDEKTEREEKAEPEQKTATPNLPEMKMNYAKTPVQPPKKKPGA